MMDPTQIGPYTVLDLLGEGGTGSVYLAKRIQGGHVALKAVHALKEASRQDQDRVKREVVVMESLDHPNVIRLVDAGFDGEWLYYAMEHCSGGSLQSLTGMGGRIPINKILELSVGMVRGLAYLHDLAIVHRDLKPANVLLDQAGIPKLSDFGLARLPSEPEESPEGRVGTPRYMAPEVQEGRPACAASDIFQMGLILYLVVAGIEFHKAHKTSGLPKGATAENLLTPSRFNNEASPKIDQLVLSCLSPEPKDRPRAGVLAEALLQIHQEFLALKGGYAGRPW